MALIPDLDDKPLEVSKEAWSHISGSVTSVTIFLESGASPMASRLFTTENSVAASIDQSVLLLFDRVAARWGLGVRLGLYSDLDLRQYEYQAIG